MPERITITVKEGKVCGFKTKTPYSGIEYYAFLGVPYGQSTAGSARFKDPVKVKPWNTILDATAEKKGCVQFSLREKKMTGTEDCLYNNIYTTKIPSKGDTLKAVMVNFHPGGFFHGSPDPSYYGAPDYIIHQDIVYVCVSLRLHVLAHLNLHRRDCLGNQGLKDAILSLQWIKQNISTFGGDPENVTVMGSSSGAMTVHLLLLSPITKGLFHKAIIMGMYAFNPLVNITEENASLAYELGKKLGYQGGANEQTKLLNFWKNLNLNKFFMARPEQYFNKTTLQVFPSSPFMASLEPGEKSPLPVPLKELIPSTNRVPLMIGFCEREACMALALLHTMKRSIGDSFHKSIQQNKLGWGADLSENELKSIRKEIEDFYLGGESIENASQSVLCDIITDAGLSDVYDTLINVVSSDLPSSVYVYNFHYDGKLCVMKAKLKPMMEKELKGAFHAADYSYWCYAKETAGNTMGNINAKDRQTIETVTKLFTTFAKTSNPNYEGMDVQWKPTTPDHPSHLIIDETLHAKDELLNGERMKFWQKLKNKYKKETKASK